MSPFSSSNSSHLTSGTTHRGVPSRCWCGNEITMFTSKTDENPYRRFYRCVQGVKDKKEKHMFRWVDDALLEEIRMIENKHKQLLEDVNVLRKMVVDNVEVQNKLMQEMKQQMNKEMNEIIQQELTDTKESLEKSNMKTVCILVVVAASILWLCGNVV
ncbi:PREDICTED: uncharacterized protein At4g04775-like [Camelina sativa]|uniref:Uncharacterized protein At4g04775-like n=1 Tax=Camelina sativa TaxID=90675 RepID=A0ABM0UTE4_CAMSA|nr:PREDICTED: uncharacterized protein At4g04775-like [Camelina sativa]